MRARVKKVAKEIILILISLEGFPSGNHFRGGVRVIIALTPLESS